MEILKKLITFFLLIIITFIYLYFFTYNLYNSLKNVTFDSDYYISEIKLEEKINSSKTFKKISDLVYSDGVKALVFGNEKYDSTYILTIVDNNLDDIIKETSLNNEKQQFRTDIFLYLTSVYDDVTSNSSSIDFNIINDIFSSYTLKMIFIILSVLLFLLIFITKDFLWIKNNVFCLLVSSFSFMISWYVIGFILSVGNPLIISNVFLSMFEHIYKINFSYCSIFFGIGILSLVLYFIFLRLFNKNKHSI